MGSVKHVVFLLMCLTPTLAWAGEWRRVCPGEPVQTRYHAAEDGAPAQVWLAETPFFLEQKSADGAWVLAKRGFDGAGAWVPINRVCNLDARRVICGADRTSLFWSNSAADLSGRTIDKGETVWIHELSAEFARISWRDEKFWVYADYLCPVDPNVTYLPRSKNLPVPYMCQVDNTYEPYSTCNNTALAMVAAFHGVWHDPDDMWGILGDAAAGVQLLARVARHIGFNYDIIYGADDAKIKAFINAGKPVLQAGFFTGSGHYIVIRGYDETGWFVNDPAGRWNGVVKGGYDGRWCRNGVGGENLHYSYESVRAAASGAGNRIGVPYL